MNTSENRTPREKFTAALTRMCQRLDAKSRFVIVDKNRMTRDLINPHLLTRASVNEEVEITALWVFGSYARGALTCGDLDVLIEVRRIDGKPRRAPLRQLWRQAFGNVRELRCYEGSPSENSQDKDFPEAVAIWGKARDWQSALAAIEPNPNATRFVRPGDQVPLRTEQLYAGQEDKEKLIEQYEQGLITWRFIPASGRTELEGRTEFEQHVLHNFGWGAKTRELIPHVFQYLRDEHRQVERFRRTEKTSIDLAGVHFAMGRPYPATQLLDELSCSRVVLIPHLSKRGPNGLLEIRRGARHPIEQAFAGVRAWAIKSPHGLLFRLQLLEVYHGSQDFGTVMELFASEQYAQAWIIQERGGMEEGQAYKDLPVCLEGASLSDAISQADTLEMPLLDEVSMIYLTHQGAALDGSDFSPVTAHEVVVALREQATGMSRAKV